jgi:hypothetical protein
MPGESIFEALSPTGGLNGWDLAEPGNYTVQVALELEGQGVIVSNPVRLRIEPPKDYEEERLAQDFFSDEVGRVLAMVGSRFFERANDTLREITERLPGRRAAVHAAAALTGPLVRDYKLLAMPDEVPPTLTSAKSAGGVVNRASADVGAARKLLEPALKDMRQMAATLGPIGLKRIVEGVSHGLAADGQNDQALGMQDSLQKALEAEHAPRALVADVEQRKASLSHKA